MRITRGLGRTSSPAGGVLTIGNFDGLHLGHQSLLSRLTSLARERGLTSTVMTFEPHPREFFNPTHAPGRLYGLREKLCGLASAGVEHVHLFRFDRRFAALSATAFVDEVLRGQLDARHVIVGDDFRFGAGRTGDFSFLRQLGARHGFSVEEMPSFLVDGRRASSSAIRAALAQGDLALAERLLGHPYRLGGKVIHGRKLGRTLRFPTANLLLRQRRLTLGGVFVVSVDGLGGAPVRGVANVGMRPTLGNSLRPTLEVHLFGGSFDCYGHHLTVRFLCKLRDERRFESLEALAEQISHDVSAAQRWFADHDASGAAPLPSY